MQSSALFQQISDGVSALPENERNDLLKKVSGIFQINIKNGSEEVIRVFYLILRLSGP
jgi:hypothetical protein